MNRERTLYHVMSFTAGLLFASGAIGMAEGDLSGILLVASGTIAFLVSLTGR